MKPGSTTLRLLLLAALPLLTDCATPKTQQQNALAAKKDQKAATQPLDPATATDSRDDYGSESNVADPLEGLNRATFAFNDKLYTFVVRPVAKGYVAAIPLPVRKGVDNVFENVKFPVRFVNSTLQGKFKRAGLETGKFAVNTIAGFGGFLRSAERVPALANLPGEDTGQTFGTWGIGHGPYIVLPLLGPSTARDTVGLAGDYALNPVQWGVFAKGDIGGWSWVPSTVNTVRSMPSQLDYYDEARQNAVDPYLSVRSIYVQNRNAVTAD